MSVKCTTCDKSCSFRKEPFSSDYAALLARHNALVEALKEIKQRAEYMNWGSVAKIARRALEEK